MYIELIDIFLKSLGIYLCIAFSFLRILNYTSIGFSRKIVIFISSTTLAIIESFVRRYMYSMSFVIILYTVYGFILAKIFKNKLGYSLLVITISSSISYGAYIISSFIVSLLIALFPNYSYKNPINFIFIFCLEFYLIHLLFRTRRFKSGFPFIKNKNKNEFLDIFILVACVIIIFIYFLILNYHSISFKYLFVFLLFFTVFMLIITQKTFIIYQKQKLLEKTIKDYEQELYEKQTQLETILKEKNNLIKANHEFYHRQKALSLKLDNLMKSKNLLFKEEYGSFVDRIDTLAKEYNNVIADTKISNSIPKTNIPEIDDMFIYMQNECNKNNIEFTLKLTCDAYQLINNIIPKNKLETLIGDLIRNSIIAINHSSNEAKAIMVILGIKNNIYEFSVYDTGIEFQIDTLLKLGKECATTHKDSGGTGIGFITTFETLKYCSASLIITEFSDKSFNYTKSVTIKFDNKSDYIIETYRLHDFYEKGNIRNDLIIKPNSSNSIFSQSEQSL